MTRSVPGAPLSYNRNTVTLDFLGTLERTHMCGDLRAADAGKNVVVMGWVNRRRDHGNLIFLDLRDRSGITQVVFDKEHAPEAHARAEAARPEFVVAATGTVRRRATGLENPNMPTGEVEVAATQLLLLNDAKTPPFSPAEDAIVNEEVRLKYRYLDLRRAPMQHNFRLRHEVARAIRNYLSDAGFLEIETPFMTRSTPEGARDYLVPSRVHAGEFYALPQSPQIFKQILMVSGFDKYFQIARCFRDEDLRADRQPEFTQIDLEMTFPQQELIFKTVEGFLTAAFKTAGVELKAALRPHDLRRGHPQLRHRQAGHAPARHGRAHRRGHPRVAHGAQDRAGPTHSRLSHPPGGRDERHRQTQHDRRNPQVLRRLRASTSSTPRGSKPTPITSCSPRLSRAASRALICRKT